MIGSDLNKLRAGISASNQLEMNKEKDAVRRKTPVPKAASNKGILYIVGLHINTLYMYALLSLSPT